MIYEVTWSMDVVAMSPEQAARLAWEMLHAPDTKLTVVIVKDERSGLKTIFDVETDPPTRV